jgi:DNA-nicking Smr family endonuclease
MTPVTQTTKDLKTAWQDAEAKAHKLQADKDQALAKVRDRYADKQRKANDEAAAAQKAYLDAQATDELRSRDDQDEAARIAENLGLTL